ncbi:MAG: GGDEF domain-containing protein [Butyrivibrio sp.]|uniref:GGDEF domain-containing protein n=1 Tax=Butyrivibrio sp. TaxID=28121 RepID=UPI0025C44FAD|nr:GGDEF domain-containing protein [Butyrivibrio sp.]MBQ6588830.1 GGDEF domain-containing protein [Butyrivibrio sp.]
MTMIPIEMQIKPFILLIILVCLISLNIIYFKTNESIGNKREVRAFKGMLISYMVYALVDFRLLIGDGFYTAFPELFVKLVISAGFVSMTFSCYFWFMHVSANLQKPSSDRAILIWKILIHIPLAIVLILFLTPLHVYAYELTGGTAVFKPMIGVVLLLDYAYLIYATAISIHNKRRARTKMEKKKYRSQIIFILAFTVSGILIGFLLNLPAIELCVIPVVLKLFAELQDSQIYTDALTKLYNRRRMTDFMAEEISKCSEENPFAIMMIDMDFFKNINDILGHDEGDKVLISFANSIRESIDSRNAIGGRWGGDEFIVAGKGKDVFDGFRERMLSALENDKDLEYIPSFSMGIYSCTSSDINYEQAIEKADAALYEDKEVRHADSGTFVNMLKEIKKNR